MNSLPRRRVTKQCSHIFLTAFLTFIGWGITAALVRHEMARIERSVEAVDRFFSAAAVDLCLFVKDLANERH